MRSIIQHSGHAGIAVECWYRHAIELSLWWKQFYRDVIDEVERGVPDDVKYLSNAHLFTHVQHMLTHLQYVFMLIHTYSASFLFMIWAIPKRKVKVAAMLVFMSLP